MTEAALQDPVLKTAPAQSTRSGPQSVHIVVQRYRSCNVLLQETEWVSVGSESLLSSASSAASAASASVSSSDNHKLPSHCGMLVYISFASSTEKAIVQQAAQTVLNLSVLTTGLWGDGISAQCSLLELAARGPHQASLVVVPQANLISKVKSQGKSIQYHGQIGKEQGEQLYAYFIDCIRGAILEEQCRVRQQALPEGYSLWKDTNILASTTASSSVQKSAASLLQADPETPPDQIFRAPFTSRYASWDETTGFPLTDSATGEPLTKSAVKKLLKLQDAHAKRHAKWKTNNPNHDATAAATAVSVSTMALSGTADTTADTTNPAEHADARADQRELWQSALDPAFLHVVAGSFGKRQGLEMKSDMGPFCHVLQL
jgi:D-Tyr-tRNAtyr deacylase